MGPRTPTVRLLLLFHTGAPVLVVKWGGLNADEGRCWGGGRLRGREVGWRGEEGAGGAGMRRRQQVPRGAGRGPGPGGAARAGDGNLRPVRSRARGATAAVVRSARARVVRRRRQRGGSSPRHPARAPRAAPPRPHRRGRPRGLGASRAARPRVPGGRGGAPAGRRGCEISCGGSRRRAAAAAAAAGACAGLAAPKERPLTFDGSMAAGVKGAPGGERGPAWWRAPGRAGGWSMRASVPRSGCGSRGPRGGRKPATATC
jgi:hypothetical protein